MKANTSVVRESVPLRVIIVEDSEDDALLIVHELRRGGYSPEFELVTDRESLKTALLRNTCDIVITDHRLPNFSSDAALETVHAYDKDIPVIIVSGSIGEDFAVGVMRAGAHDYIMKENLARLVPVVERELREYGFRKAGRQAEDAVKYLENHDRLTGLSNRVGFEEHLKLALNRVKQENASYTFLYIDLDQFKIINDTCGHKAGDRLLVNLTGELKKKIRKKDLLARLGGDEFGVLLANCSADKAKQIATDIQSVINGYRFDWQGSSFTISASIGVVVLSKSFGNYLDVMSTADMACYAAKDSGRNRIQIYHKDDNELLERQDQMRWAATIERALHDNWFFLHQQRIVSLKTLDGPLPAYEFLVRMRKEDGGIASPGEFIPAAERYKLMPLVDQWVINHAFSYLKQGLGKHKPGIYFINLSGRSLTDDHMYHYIREKLREYNIPPELICFEITETVAIKHFNRAINFIKEVKSEGCFFALDDFGVGASSFAYLKSLPVDYVKIDGSFIVDMLNDPMDQEIVQSITNIGHVKGLKIVAEFVESLEVMQKLKEMGVDFAQGFGIEKPVPLEGEDL
jgi:diguanylate cyclase (GGDEF)-like protein